MPTLTLTEAQKLLTNLPPDVKIELRKKRTGGVELNNSGDKPLTKEDYLEQNYKHLMGKTITLSEAAKKYSVPRGTISSWIYHAHYLEPVGESYPLVVSEAEIKCLVDIYKKRRETGSKAPLLDENGLPYELKHPKLAAYRRRKKKGIQ